VNVLEEATSAIVRVVDHDYVPLVVRVRSPTTRRTRPAAPGEGDVSDFSGIIRGCWNAEASVVTAIADSPAE
jgi:hypothetical protein